MFQAPKNLFMHSEFIKDLNLATEEVKNTFSGLSGQNLNWKTDPAKWSIAQILHHIIVSNEKYFPQFDQIISGKKKNSFSQNFFLTHLFGKWLLKTVSREIKMKMKTPLVFYPSNSPFDQKIISDFVEHQKKMESYIVRISAVNFSKNRVSSPALKVFSFSVPDCFCLLINHEFRHIKQAKNLLKSMPQ